MHISLDQISPYDQSDADIAFQALCGMDPNDRVWQDPGESRFRGTVMGRASPDALLVPIPSVLPCSGFYHWTSRMNCGHRTTLSPGKLMEGLRVSPAGGVAIRGALRKGVYTACQFNPAVAKAVVKELTGRGSRVLDPCAGWGDRLAGSAACHHVIEYLGFDPNTSLISGYREQVINYGKLGQFQVITQPFETAKLPVDYFDLAFTSPPYFDTEIYSDDKEQSSVKYPTFDEWVPGFYEPMLVASAAAVKPGGYLALNVANVQRKSSVLPLPDLAVSILEDLRYWSLKYLWGLRINRRNICEPILVWQKEG